MPNIKIRSLELKNYRSFGNASQKFDFTKAIDKKLPLAIIGYNNVGKTNLINSILYGIGHTFVSENTFEKHDLFNLTFENNISIKSNLLRQDSKSNEQAAKYLPGEDHVIKTSCEHDQIKSNGGQTFFGKNKNYQIFYINFHKIKEEISTQKTSWGKLQSFLAKHIKKLLDKEKQIPGYETKRNNFRENSNININKILENTKLSQFIQKIKNNYSTNLRDTNCEVDFGLPEYEDIFLQMIFKIGLNGNNNKLIPINHFGDGYISMFVMAVIQAIAEEEVDDKCLFIFEEPESFLHENHQEYFYKTVLCELAKKGHQVIYTTHSDKMVDITEPDSLIRLKFNNEGTIKAFPTQNVVNPLEKPENQEVITQYNQYIKSIEPNLNKILFSEKVILVEGPNDLLVYKYLIEKKARQKANINEKVKDRTNEEKQKWAEVYLNFNNIAIIPHHGKATAYLLADLCKYLGVDYYLINDWDFDSLELDIDTIKTFETEEKLKQSDIYESQTDSNKKGMITTNWKLLDSAKNNQIHFNIKKLETIINYNSDDKSPLKIWKTIKQKYINVDNIKTDIFPETLSNFLFENEKNQTSLSI